MIGTRITHMLLRKFGLDFYRIYGPSSQISSMKALMKSAQINVVLDVGANIGQYAIRMRKELRFTGKIVSFEPLSREYSILEKKSCADESWQVEKMALGDRDEVSQIHIAGNSVSSSLLEMLPLHLNAAPRSRYIKSESIQVRRLDGVFDQYCKPDDRVLLKIDTQGFEDKVLKGAGKAIERIDMVQLEMSLAPLYEGQALYSDLHGFLVGQGFSMVDVERGFVDPHSGRLLQFDGIYLRQPR